MMPQFLFHFLNFDDLPPLTFIINFNIGNSGLEGAGPVDETVGAENGAVVVELDER